MAQRWVVVRRSALFSGVSHSSDVSFWQVVLVRPREPSESSLQSLQRERRPYTFQSVSWSVSPVSQSVSWSVSESCQSVSWSVNLVSQSVGQPVLSVGRSVNWSVGQSVLLVSPSVSWSVDQSVLSVSRTVSQLVSQSVLSVGRSASQSGTLTQGGWRRGSSLIHIQSLLIWQENLKHGETPHLVTVWVTD